MIVRLSVEVSDEVRRVLRARHGQRGLATRTEIRRLIAMLVQQETEQIMDEHRRRDLR